LYHSKTSAHDGYYVFEQVPYGRYELAIADNQGVRSENRPLVVVSRDYAAVSDVDLIVVAPEMSAPTLLTPAVRPPAQEISEAPRALTPLAATKSASQMAAPVVETPATGSSALRPGRDGRYVQLGAYSDQVRAKLRVDELVGRGLLSAQQIEIVESDRGAKGLFQIVRASPGQGSAEALCRRLKSAGDTCFTVAP